MSAAYSQRRGRATRRPSPSPFAMYWQPGSLRLLPHAGIFPNWSAEPLPRMRTFPYIALLCAAVFVLGLVVGAVLL